ncbi:MAG: hypothetical protein HC827_23735 [Cyanobacteria bacterium RM1_2_2]|nr:hypothetical protein [Cyanobacteria bacterium RM1_2_2]
MVKSWSSHGQVMVKSWSTVDGICLIAPASKKLGLSRHRQGSRWNGSQPPCDLAKILPKVKLCCLRRT